MRTVFENGMIITVDDRDTVFKTGYVVVDNDKISEIGEGQYRGGHEGALVINAAGKALMPGIVDAHTHIAGSVFKGLIEDDPNGFYGFALPMEGSLTREDVYHLALLGAWECMQSGITTINEIYHYILSVAKAVDEIGLRTVISQNIVDVNIGDLRYNNYTRYPEMAEGFIEDNITLIEQYHGKDNGRITCRFGPHATDTVSMDLAKRIVGLGEKYGVGFHTHVAQSRREVAYLDESCGLSPVEYLRETGLIGDHMLAAHCIYTDSKDVDILASSGTHMLHCAEALGRNGDFPPTKEMFEKGVHIVLGTDWLTQDPWANLRAGIFLNRRAGVPNEIAGGNGMLRRSTIEPARALGLSDKIGSLETGKQADIIMIDLSGPNLTPMFHDPVVTIAYNATRYDISDVMIDGKFTVRDRALLTMKESTLMDNGQRVAMEVYGRHVATMN